MVLLRNLRKYKINKFPFATANTGWEWSKTVTVSGNVDSIQTCWY